MRLSMVKVLGVTLGLVALSLANRDYDYEPYVYNVSRDGEVCLSVQLAAEFTVTYPVDNQTNFTAQLVLPRQNDTSISGNCFPQNGTGEHRVTLFVKFAAGDNEEKDELFAMAFNVTANAPGKISDWAVVEISLTYSPKSFPKSISPDSGVTVSFADPSISSSSGAPYKCSSESTLHLEDDSKKHVVPMKYKDVLLYPATEKGRNVEVCKDDNKKKKTDKIVPIAVGCALAGLLLIVIIAWLVGRSSARTGYKEV